MTPQVSGAGSSTLAKARAPQNEDMAKRYVMLRPKGIARPVSVEGELVELRDVRGFGMTSDLLHRSSEQSLVRTGGLCCGILHIFLDLHPVQGENTPAVRIGLRTMRSSNPAELRPPGRPWTIHHQCRMCPGGQGRLSFFGHRI